MLRGGRRTISCDEGSRECFSLRQVFLLLELIALPVFRMLLKKRALSPPLLEMKKNKRRSGSGEVEVELHRRFNHYFKLSLLSLSSPAARL